MIARLLLLAVTLFSHGSATAFDTFNPSLAQRLDSRDCQACHDGVLAHDIGKSHPIGVDYRLAQLKSKGKLRDMSLLVPPLQFENGRIGCLTCHAPDSPLPGHLVISNGGSRLCLLCHAL